MADPALQLLKIDYMHIKSLNIKVSKQLDQPPPNSCTETDFASRLFYSGNTSSACSVKMTINEMEGFLYKVELRTLLCDSGFRSCVRQTLLAFGFQLLLCFCGWVPVSFGVWVYVYVWLHVRVYVCVGGCVFWQADQIEFFGGERHERETAASVFDVQGEQSAERLPALYQQRNTLPIVWEEEGARCCVLMCLFVCDLINRRTPKGPAQSTSLSLWDWLLSVSKRGCMCVSVCI